MQPSKCQALITIALLKKEKTVRYVPTSFHMSSGGMYYYNYYGGEIILPAPVQEAGYFVNYVDYSRVSSFYDV